MFNKIITHNGQFHNDEVLATAILFRINPNAEVVRTRNAAIIAEGKGDDQCVVVDVGCEYYPEQMMFDHHQSGCEEVFQYIGGKSRLASAGMVWQHFGKKISGVDTIMWMEVYKNLIEEIDRQDNGEDPVGRGPVFQISGFNPSWESNSNGDEEFQNAVVIAGEFLANTISRSRGVVKAGMLHRETMMLNELRCANTKRAAEAEMLHHKTVINNDGCDGLFVMDQYYPWTPLLLKEEDHPYRFVVYPRQDGDWAIQSIPVSSTGFENKGSLPLEWVDGDIDGMVFCHKARFIASFTTKERAIEMALYAVSQL